MSQHRTTSSTRRRIAAALAVATVTVGGVAAVALPASAGVRLGAPAVTSEQPAPAVLSLHRYNN